MATRSPSTILSPTSSPTANPTSTPTVNPTFNPTETVILSPTADPTFNPTASPTRTPTSSPTENPFDRVEPDLEFCVDETAYAIYIISLQHTEVSSFCNAQGMEFAAIKSEVERSGIESAITQNPLSFQGRDIHLAIVRNPLAVLLGIDDDDPRAFEYLDGDKSNQTLSFLHTAKGQSPWQAGEPNNFQNRNEDCVHMRRSLFLFNDNRCIERANAMCTFPCGQPTTRPTLSPTPPTENPTSAPTVTPTETPTLSPTPPTESPTIAPTLSPMSPTENPTSAPTETPSATPTLSPTLPTEEPTTSPSGSPSISPTPSPIGRIEPVVEVCVDGVGFALFATTMKQDRAAEFCEAQGGLEFGAIKTEQQRAALQLAANGVNLERRTYIAILRNVSIENGDEEPSSFLYIDGDVSEEALEFLHVTQGSLPWSPSEPNNFEKNDENCVELREDIFRFNDISCDVPLNVLCSFSCSPTSSPIAAPTTSPSGPTPSPETTSSGSLEGTLFIAVGIVSALMFMFFASCFVVKQRRISQRSSKDKDKLDERLVKEKISNEGEFTTLIPVGSSPKNAIDLETSESFKQKEETRTPPSFKGKNATKNLAYRKNKIISQNATTKANKIDKDL